MIKILNIINDETEILRLTNLASIDNHKNSSNYTNFKDRLKDTIAFHVVYYNNEAVAFSGMYQSKKWSKKIVRICDRTFYFKKARTSGLNFINEKELKHIASTYFIPEQTKIAVEKNLIPFYSIEKITRRKALIKQVQLVNEMYNMNYYVLPGMYWTCNSKVSDNDKCWQSVATLENFCNDIDLPCKSVSYFIDRKSSHQ